MGKFILPPHVEAQPTIKRSSFPMFDTPRRDENQTRHSDDGAVEPRPQMTDEVQMISARTLGDITRSVEALGRGEASPPVNLDEAVPGMCLAGAMGGPQ